MKENNNNGMKLKMKEKIKILSEEQISPNIKAISIQILDPVAFDREVEQMGNERSERKLAKKRNADRFMPVVR